MTVLSCIGLCAVHNYIGHFQELRYSTVIPLNNSLAFALKAG